MPRKLRRPRRRRQTFAELDTFQLLDLLVGWDLGAKWLRDAPVDLRSGRWRREVDECRLRAWREHRDTLLRYWIQSPDRWAGHLEALHPRGPGYRPHAWWAFESPEPRRFLGGEGKPTEPVKLAFGVPTSWRSINPWSPPIFESQPAYLVRNKLLLPGERHRLVQYPLGVDAFGHPSAIRKVKK